MDESNLLGKMQEILSDPESMKQISELAQMLKTDNQDTKSTKTSDADLPPAPDLPFDTGLLMKAGEFLRHEPDKNTALLLALRPHLKEQRQTKIDKAVKLLHIWSIFKQLQASGMLQNYL